MAIPAFVRRCGAAAVCFGSVACVGSALPGSRSPGLEEGERPLPESIVACGPQVPLPLGTPVLSSTLVGDDMVRGSCVRGSAPECVFMLDVPVRSDVRVSLESADFDGALVLFDEQRSAELSCVDDQPSGDTHHARIEATLAPGRYAVMVEGANGEAGQFSLFAEVDPLPTLTDACAAAPEITPGRSVRGSTRGAPNQFGARCAAGAEGPDRAYSFAVTTPSRVRIWQQGEYEGTLSLRSSCIDQASELVCDADVDPSGRSLITANLLPGRYTVISDSFARTQSGDYVLSLERADAPAPRSAEAVCQLADSDPLLPGERELDTLYAPSALGGSCGGNGAPERLFHLRLEQETTLQAELLDAEFDAVIYLRVECDDERSELSCVRMPRRPAAEAEQGPPTKTFTATIGPGDYTLGVDGQFENDMGAARLRVGFLPMSVSQR
jgi:hypothetical protein